MYISEEDQKRIDNFDKKIAHLIWTIFLSMITAIITTVLCTR